MSVAVRAVRGAAWTIVTTVGSRAIFTVGTIVIAYFLAPEVFGEVAVAHVIALTAVYIANLGVDRYVVAVPDCGREAAFHASVLHIATGFAGLAIVVALAEPISVWFDAAVVSAFVPGMALAMAIERVGQMPEKILTRDMRFRALGISRTVGNMGFVATSVGLAIAGWGGYALVIANVVRSAIHTMACMTLADRREWLEVHPLRWEACRPLLRFGLPLSAGGLANMAARDWDDLIIGWMFGMSALGSYRMAYRLADIPATEVGETIGDVLLPSFAQMEREQRREALIRSSALLTLILAPMAVGLGVVADTLIAAVLPPKWEPVAPLLTVLSVISVVRPIGWTIGVYLQSCSMTRPIMVLEFAKVLLLLAAVTSLATLNILWACAGIGVAFGLHSVACVWVADRYDRVDFKRHLMGIVGPIVACAPMAAAVYGVRYGVLAVWSDVPLLVLLAAEVLTGAAVYVASALGIARDASTDFIGLIKRALRRGGE